MKHKPKNKKPFNWKETVVIALIKEAAEWLFNIMTSE